MDTLDLQAFGASGTSTAVAVTSSSSYIQVAALLLGSDKRAGLLTLIAGAGGALGALKLTRAATIGGTHVDWMSGSDFDSPVAGDAVRILPATGLATLGAGLSGQINFHGLGGIAEINVWAKKASANTTLLIQSSFSQ